MPHEYNWNDVAYEMAPMAQYSDLYSNQPRIYMFEGATLLDLVLLAAAAVLSLFWIIYLYRSESGLAKALLTVNVTLIFVTVCTRVVKVAILLLIEYPQFSWLFVTTSVETSFHYTLYVLFTSSVVLYVLLRHKQVNTSWALLFFLPLVVFSVVISVLNVNFNQLLYTLPFYVYVIVYVAMSVANLVILIGVLTSCIKLPEHKPGMRCLFFLFVFISTPPILFTTVITVMDLLFMVVGVTEQFPIPYIVMTTYRYKAFEITPVFIMIAFFAMIKDLKKWSQPTVSSSEVTTITMDPQTTSTSYSKTNIEHSAALTTSASTSRSTEVVPDPVPIPNTVPQQVANPHQHGPGPYGALLVHIQPIG